MKQVKKVFEFIITILLAIIIVSPEIIYSCLFEVRDWISEKRRKLWLNKG